MLDNETTNINLPPEGDMYVTKAMEEINIDRERWKNRRHMAWLSLVSMIVLTTLIIFLPESLLPVAKVAVVSDFITWYYFACTGVIGAYMGVTTFAHVKK